VFACPHTFKDVSQHRDVVVAPGFRGAVERYANGGGGMENNDTVTVFPSTETP
jgi:hypothetical protein